MQQHGAARSGSIEAASGRASGRASRRRGGSSSGGTTAAAALPTKSASVVTAAAAAAAAQAAEQQATKKRAKRAQPAIKAEPIEAAVGAQPAIKADPIEAAVGAQPMDTADEAISPPHVASEPRAAQLAAQQAEPRQQGWAAAPMAEGLLRLGEEAAHGAAELQASNELGLELWHVRLGWGIAHLFWGPLGLLRNSLIPVGNPWGPLDLLLVTGKLLRKWKSSLDNCCGTGHLLEPELLWDWQCGRWRHGSWLSSVCCRLTKGTA